MLFWNLTAIATFMDALGIANANQLRLAARLTIPTTYKLLSGHAVERLEVATLAALVELFDCEPWALLEFRKR